MVSHGLKLEATDQAAVFELGARTRCIITERNEDSKQSTFSFSHQSITQKKNKNKKKTFACFSSLKTLLML